jgi:hypothetical protein
MKMKKLADIIRINFQVLTNSRVRQCRQMFADAGVTKSVFYWGVK